MRLWDVATGHLIRTLKGRRGYVQSVAFSPDGRTLATASLDTTIRLWDVATGRTIRVRPMPSEPSAMPSTGT